MAQAAPVPPAGAASSRGSRPAGRARPQEGALPERAHRTIGRLGGYTVSRLPQPLCDRSALRQGPISLSREWWAAHSSGLSRRAPPAGARRRRPSADDRVSVAAPAGMSTGRPPGGRGIRLRGPWAAGATRVRSDLSRGPRIESGQEHADHVLRARPLVARFARGVRPGRWWSRGGGVADRASGVGTQLRSCEADGPNGSAGRRPVVTAGRREPLAA